MSAVGGQVGGDCSVDFSRQRLGQNPRERALEWDGLCIVCYWRYSSAACISSE